MAKGVEQFSFFAAEILNRLYDNFPILIKMEVSDFIGKQNIPLEFDKQAVEELKDYYQRKEILKGTMEFLIKEGFMRCEESLMDDVLCYGGQLTAKGFSHLHKEFKDNSISDVNPSIIKWIKNRLANPSSIEGSIIVNVISTYLT